MSLLMWDLKVSFPEWGLSLLGEILLFLITVDQVLLLNQEPVLLQKLREIRGVLRKEC